MTNSNQYWKGLEEIETSLSSTTNQGEFGDEGLPLDEVFSDSEGLSSNRRDFLKYFGLKLIELHLMLRKKTIHHHPCLINSCYRFQNMRRHLVFLAL